MNVSNISSRYYPIKLMLILIIAMLVNSICAFDPRRTNTEDENDYPFIVDLQILLAEDDEFHTLECTGALISSRVVLTAAHCLKGSDGSFLQAKTVTAIFSIRGEIDFTISTVQWVYKYGSGKASDDIAMILLPDPVPLVCEKNKDQQIGDRIVSIIRLPIKSLEEFSNIWDDEQIEYDACKIFGRGSINEGDKSLDSLLRTSSKNAMPIVINNHKFIHFRNKLDNSSELSICQGDSGSPLVCTHSGLQYVLGVAAFTAGRKIEAKPLCVGDIGADRFGFFEDIRQHLQWIHDELTIYGLFEILKEDYTKCAF